MATNKHATIRYHALDQCFSNSGRKYYIEDLIEACNAALYEYSGSTDGIKRRQLFEDIKFMESEQGWFIPLERIKDGRKTYYKYSDWHFSINNQLMNESEANQLKEMLQILNRFKGMPQFEWMEEVLLRIESEFKLKPVSKPIVDFEQNQYLAGLDYLTTLFNAIQYRRVLEIEYKSYKQSDSSNLLIHPYFLKQYNNRWFLFGLNEEYTSISNIAIDRILDLKETNKKYIENESIDFEEYFEDIVGVTVLTDIEPKKILISVDSDLYPYIKSKPIHGSQKTKEENSDSVIIELHLQINYELITLLFSFGERVRIIEPEHLKKTLKDKAEKVFKNYF